MPLKVKCRCGVVLTVPTQRIGKSVRCPSCSETVLITQPKQTPPPQSSRPQEAKKPQATPQSVSKPAEHLGTSKPESSKPSKPTEKEEAKTQPARSKAEPKKKPDSRPQDQQESAESAKPSGKPQRTPTINGATSSADVKPVVPRKPDAPKQAITNTRDQKLAVEPSEQKERSPVVEDARKEPKKSSDSESVPAKAAVKPKAEGSIPADETVHGKGVQEKPKPTSERAKRPESSEAAAPAVESSKEVKADRSKPESAPPNPRENLTANDGTKSPKASTSAHQPESKSGTAKKLPPALKRESSLGKEKTKEEIQSQSRSEKPATPTKKLPATDSNVETAGASRTQPQAPKKISPVSDSNVKATKPPPPLKPKTPVAKTQAGSVAAPKEAKDEPPPIRKQPPGLRQTLESRPKKSSPKQKSRRTKTKRADKDAAKSEEQSPVRGIDHDPAKRWSAYYLAIGIIFVGLFNMAPAFYEGFQAFRLDPPRPLARWAYAALVLGLVQIVYAFYLIQLPDWGSVWVVAIFSLVTTTMYAALVSAVILGTQDSNLLESLHLSYVSRKRAILWCTIMLSLSALLTYFCGRVGIRWHKAFSIAYPTTTNPSNS
jgi:hypothetical protein